MLALPHPEVLSIDWLPPTLPARGSQLRDAELALDRETDRHETRFLAVEGPEGAGTSVVARRAVRAWMDRRYCGGEWRALPVRVRPCRGTATVAGALLRHFDPGFEPRGFPAMEILAGCLRRLKREGKPAAIVLDDLDPGAPPLAPIVRGLASPVRFLPEGDENLPPLTVVLAGRPAAVDRIRRASGLSIPRVTLPPYSFTELETIVRERLARALGREAPADLAHAIVRRAHEEGRGAARALDLLRRELTGWTASRASSVYRPLGRERRLWVEEHLVRAIELASRPGAPTLREVRERERATAREAGVAPLPTTTFWRRVVRLEQAGYLRREVRTGGAGGSRSRLYVLLPVAEWITIPRAAGTPRASGPAFGAPEARVGPLSAPSW